MKKYDVIIIGGGFAGIGAAISAAREGVKVLLVEKGNSLGGAAVNCLVNPFMPTKTKIEGEEIELSKGIFETIRKKLIEKGALLGIAFLEEELKLILNDMMEEYDIDLLFHAYICDANRKGDKIQSISVATISGIERLEADYFIDATGDAQLAFLAGCPTVLGRQTDHLCQPMTLCFRLGNVDVERFYASRERLKVAHEKALENGELINPRENVLVFKLPVPNVLHFNTTRVVKLNPTSALDVSKAEVIDRKQVHEIYNFMKKHADGLENSYLMSTASEIGVRESRKIVGEYILTEKDCWDYKRFEDAICACNYSIDIHSPEGTGTKQTYFPEGKYYTIPYRSLIPKTLSNTLVAGRCISSDHGAQASYRIMPTVCCIGEGAGTAIALAIKNKCSTRQINIDELQKILIDNGAFLG